MSKTKVHVLIPFTNKAACGIVNPYINGLSRGSITCIKCKDTQYFKDLPPTSKIKNKRRKK